MSDGSKLNPNEMKLSGSKYIFVNLMSAPDKLLMVPLKLNWNGMEKAAASKLEWMMQQTSSALALEKIDDNGNGFKWLAGQNPSWSEKKGFSMSLEGRNYQNHTKNSEIRPSTVLQNVQ